MAPTKSRRNTANPNRLELETIYAEHNGNRTLTSHINAETNTLWAGTSSADPNANGSDPSKRQPPSENMICIRILYNILYTFDLMYHSCNCND